MWKPDIIVHVPSAHLKEPMLISYSDACDYVGRKIGKLADETIKTKKVPINTFILSLIQAAVEIVYEKHKPYMDNLWLEAIYSLNQNVFIVYEKKLEN